MCAINLCWSTMPTGKFAKHEDAAAFSYLSFICIITFSYSSIEDWWYYGLLQYNNEYMSFGVSPKKDRSEMIGADVVVAWVDKETGKGYAEDYYMDDKSQCSGGRGVCPELETNSIRLLNAAMVNGYSIVTYQRSLQATDKYDLPITTNGTEAVVWAIGPLNERKEASFHSYYPKRSYFIDFGRAPTWNCPMPEGSKAATDSDDNDEEDTDAVEEDNERQQTQSKEKERNKEFAGYPPAKQSYKGKDDVEEEFYDNRAQALQKPSNANRRQETNALQRPRPVPTPKPVSGNQAWDIPAIQCHEPEDGVFYAQMGPTGGKHGYSAITGHVGWGISWYINGLLIPEIHVVRGKTYTFVVEGGNNPDIPAKYHPFYITDDPIGGYEHKREEEKKSVRIFAGVHRSRSGQVTPTGVGRLCNWTPDIDGPPADDYQSFGAYQRTLTLKCDDGEPGVITWKPDRNTPDTVYYHCFTHRYLGWKIHVHDSCDENHFAASEKHEIRLPAYAEHDVEVSPSIRHETKVSPNDYFLLMHQKDLIKNHNMNGTPPKLTFEITKSTEITKLISDGIRAAEALEESILRNAQNAQNVNNARPGVQHTTSHASSATSQTGHVDEDVQRIPPKLYIPPAAPEILHGETHIHAHTPTTHSHSNIHTHTHHNTNHYNSPNIKLPPHYGMLKHPHMHLNSPTSHLNRHSPSNNLTNLPITAQKTIGLSEYLRPPQNAPVFHPVKLPGRRPYPAPIKKTSASKPVLPQQLPRHPAHTNQQLPQPSVIVNHYRKPVMASMLKPFFKEKPFPIQPLAASVLLLGQPTELNSHRKTQPILHPKPKPKPIIPVPYSDLEPQGAVPHNAYVFNANLKNGEKKPQLPVKPTTTQTTRSSHAPSSTTPIFKRPFDVHPVKEDNIDSVTLLPAINNGFQPQSVVVESGFKPIRRDNGLAGDQVEQVANRREDPGTEIDEAMESDTLFLAAQSGTQTQNFEPMFIPSPPDSTNETIVIRKQPMSVLKINAVPVRSLALTATQNVDTQYEPLPNIEDLFETAEEKKTVKKTQSEPIKYEKVVDNEEDSETESQEAEVPIQLQPQLNIKNIKTFEKPQSDQIDEDFESELSDEFEDIFDTDSNEQSSETTLQLKQIQMDGEHKYDKEVYEQQQVDQQKDDTEDEKEAQAAERIDTYYLPPDNRKIPNANIPSGAVVTYDGKSVIDSSLVLPPKLDSHNANTNTRYHPDFGLSKTEQLVRSTPQFQPFRGEIPPAISELLGTENASKHSVNPLTDYSNPITTPHYHSSTTNTQHTTRTATVTVTGTARPKSTKLQLLKNNA